MYASIYVCMYVLFYFILFYFILLEKRHIWIIFIHIVNFIEIMFLLYILNCNSVFILILFNYLVILTLIRIRIIYMHHMHLFFYMKLNLSGTISVLKYLMFNKTLQWWYY